MRTANVPVDFYACWEKAGAKVVGGECLSEETRKIWRKQLEDLRVEDADAGVDAVINAPSCTQAHMYRLMHKRMRTRGEGLTLRRAQHIDIFGSLEYQSVRLDRHGDLTDRVRHVVLGGLLLDGKNEEAEKLAQRWWETGPSPTRSASGPVQQSAAILRVIECVVPRSALRSMFFWMMNTSPSGGFAAGGDVPEFPYIDRGTRNTLPRPVPSKTQWQKAGWSSQELKQEDFAGRVRRIVKEASPTGVRVFSGLKVRTGDLKKKPALVMTDCLRYFGVRTKRKKRRAGKRADGGARYDDLYTIDPISVDEMSRISYRITRRAQGFPVPPIEAIDPRGPRAYTSRSVDRRRGSRVYNEYVRMMRRPRPLRYAS